MGALNRSNAGLGKAPQTLQNVTGSRAAGTVYTNSGALPILVSVWVSASLNNAVFAAALNVNGAPVEQEYRINGTTSGYSSVSAVVPPGATYQLVLTQATVSYWHEVR